MLDPTTPLGLPKGSVRAIMGLIVVAAVWVRVAMGLDVSTEALSVSSVVLAGYGLWRGAEGFANRGNNG